MKTEKLRENRKNSIRKRRFLKIVNQCCEVRHKRLTLKTKPADLTLDSLSFIALIVELEHEFNIEFDDENLDIRKYADLESLLFDIKKAQKL